LRTPFSAHWIGTLWLRAKEETDVAFAIDWKGRYRIEGAAFVFVDRNTRQIRTILGYPTHQLEHVGQSWNFKYFGLAFEAEIDLTYDFFIEDIARGSPASGLIMNGLKLGTIWFRANTIIHRICGLCTGSVVLWRKPMPPLAILEPLW
jgi:hypothetical protein